MSVLIKSLLNKENCTDLLNGSCVPNVVHFHVLFNFSMDCVCMVTLAMGSCSP